MHDVEVLPHLHSEDDVERLFPKIGAPEPGLNVEDWEPLRKGKGASMAARATRPVFMAGARSVRLLLRVGGRPVRRPSATRRRTASQGLARPCR